MDYHKPWSFRLGIVVFGTVAFLAATGRSLGWDAADGQGRPTAPVAPLVAEGPARP